MNVITIKHVFRDGTTDPSKKKVPEDIVRRVYEIMLEAEAKKARRLAAESTQGVSE